MRDEENGADQFRAFIQELRDAKLSGDIHDGNAMIRKDGQLVITDPISGVYSSSKYRIKSGAIHTP
jgi:predicted unusual protein kinase regulating ubiquinone biosynthesis (AarF/ABC1/UbiB family)